MTHSPIRHEVEVDTAIAEAYRPLHRAVDRLAAAQASLSRRPSDSLYIDMVASAEAEYDEAKAAFDAANEKYGGWSRFFLVQNTNGHIHSSMHCSTCYSTTPFGWLPDLSGLTEAEAVEEWGGILCSVCFPSAPVDWTNGVNKRDAEQKAVHKALLAIERSPEGKKAKNAASDLRSHQYNQQRLLGDIERLEDPDGWMQDTHPAEVIEERLADVRKRLAKVETQLARAEAKVEAAKAALDAALAA
jgi:hypothetical protein